MILVDPRSQNSTKPERLSVNLERHRPRANPATKSWLLSSTLMEKATMLRWKDPRFLGCLLGAQVLKPKVSFIFLPLFLDGGPLDFQMCQLNKQCFEEEGHTSKGNATRWFPQLGRAACCINLRTAQLRKAFNPVLSVCRGQSIVCVRTKTETVCKQTTLSKQESLLQSLKVSTIGIDTPCPAHGPTCEHCMAVVPCRNVPYFCSHSPLQSVQRLELGSSERRLDLAE